MEWHFPWLWCPPRGSLKRRNDHDPSRSTAGQETGRGNRRLWLFPGWCRITRPGTSRSKIQGRCKWTSLESRWCPIFKATGLLVLGVKLPKKIGHLAFQIFCFLEILGKFEGVTTWNKNHAVLFWKRTYPYISHFGKKRNIILKSALVRDI